MTGLFERAVGPAAQSEAAWNSGGARARARGRRCLRRDVALRDAAVARLWHLHRARHAAVARRPPRRRTRRCARRRRQRIGIVAAVIATKLLATLLMASSRPIRLDSPRPAARSFCRAAMRFTECSDTCRTPSSLGLRDTPSILGSNYPSPNPPYSTYCGNLEAFRVIKEVSATQFCNEAALNRTLLCTAPR